MPQIANQDYFVIKGEFANYAFEDAGACLQMLNQYKRGTLLDCVVYRPGIDDPPGYGHIVGVFEATDALRILCPTHLNVAAFFMYAREDWLLGLSEIQKALDMRDKMPSPTIKKLGGTDVFYENNSRTYLCVNDKYVHIFDVDEKLGGYEVTNVTPDPGVEYVNVTTEAIDNLIGFALY